MRVSNLLQYLNQVHFILKPACHLLKYFDPSEAFATFIAFETTAEVGPDRIAYQLEC